MRFCSALLILATAFPALALENPDIQTPEEIAAAHRRVDADFAHAITPSDDAFEGIAYKYRHVDPLRQVPGDLLKKAVAYFDANRSSFPNQNYIGIVDFRPRSDVYRFFLIDLATGAVERYHTTHGEGSDLKDFARKFSNVAETKKSRSVSFAPRKFTPVRSNARSGSTDYPRPTPTFAIAPSSFMGWTA